MGQIQHSALDHGPAADGGVAVRRRSCSGIGGMKGRSFLDYFCAQGNYYDQQVFSLITPYEYLTRHPTQQVAQPSASSWGSEGLLGDVVG